MSEHALSCCTTRLLKALLLAIAFVHAFPWELIPSVQSVVSASPDEAVNAKIAVKYEDGLLTLQVQEAPLSDVLLAIGDAAGFQIVLKGDLSGPVSRSFRRLPLEKAIRRLVKGTSYIMVQRPESSGGVAAPIVQLRVSGLSGNSIIATSKKQDKQGGAAPASGTSPSEKLENSVMAGLRNADRSARLRAIRQAADLDAAVGAEILSKVLSEDQNPTVRVYAIRTLGGQGNEAALPALEVALRDGEAAVKTEAIRAVGRFSGEQAIASLRDVLLNDPDPQVRRIAVQAVAANRSEGSRGLLEEAARDSDNTVRRMVEQALARLQ